MVLPTNAFVKGHNLLGIPITTFGTAAFQFTKQTTGNELWEQLLNFPRYGGGIFFERFNTSELGNPVTAYGVFIIPLLQRGNLTLNIENRFGVSFNWKSFRHNYYNTAMGAEQVGYFDTGFSLDYKTLNGLYFTLGTNFSHFSNGSLKMPNSGINTFAPKLGLGYVAGPSPETFKHRDIPVYQKRSDWYISAFTALKNQLYYGINGDSITGYKGSFYPVYGISATFNKQLTHMSKLGVGIMTDYMGAAKSVITEKNGILDPDVATFSEGLELSIYLSYELIVSRFSLFFQPGLYLYRTKYERMTPVGYQRIGIKYNGLKRVSFGFNILAYKMSYADYVELSLGYRFQL